MHRVEQYYIQKYGADAQQVKDFHQGIHAEPHVTLSIFQEMLEEYPDIQVFLRHRLEKVLLGASRDGLSVITGVRVEDETGTMSEIEGKVFIDATLASLEQKTYSRGEFLNLLLDIVHK